ncbi:hypothetical protein [Synechococcus sp. CC9616]|uniref:hypothetical protein n=1 Tax=Synechococcus sp. CC9616 TaxID=110663 RepID=UPI00048DDB1E|nr:hypothetical protein [Synechococcus sp. CC9616]
MLPPFCCNSTSDYDSQLRHHQQRKMAMLSFWRDGLERQLSAINAAIGTLEQQIERDSQSMG